MLSVSSKAIKTSNLTKVCKKTNIFKYKKVPRITSIYVVHFIKSNNITSRLIFIYAGAIIFDLT